MLPHMACHNLALPSLQHFAAGPPCLESATLCMLSMPLKSLRQGFPREANAIGMQQALLASSLGPLVSTTGTAPTRAPVYFGVVTVRLHGMRDVCLSPETSYVNPERLVQHENRSRGATDIDGLRDPSRISKCNRLFVAAPTLAHFVHGGAWNTLLREVMFTKHVGAAMMLLYTVRLRTIERKPSSWS